MKIKNRNLIFIFAFSAMALHGAEYHVSTTGADTATGSSDAPFKTISKAAEVAQAGDTITVKAGTYREEITPPRGGTAPDKPITYQAAEGEEVIIKGSEIVTNWTAVEGNVWKVDVPNSTFGSFNPYADLIQGDWYEARQPYHSGAVFLDGHWLRQAASKDAVFGKKLNASGADSELLSFSSVTFKGLNALTTADISEKSRDLPVVNSDRGSAGLGPLKGGDWILYKGVDFGTEGVSSVTTKTGSPVGGGNVEIRLGGPEGELIGTVDAMLTAEWTFFASYSTKLTKPLTGTHDIALIVKPRPLPPTYTVGIGNWFAEVGENNTTIWADFKGKNPTEHLTEINVRQAVFYPRENHINYLSIKGFTMEQAATPWSPPTAEQVGLIGTNWSKGWLIEGNTIRYSTCTGLTLGKHGDEYDNTYDYFRSIRKGLERGWNKETIGSHIVRNNHIHDCGQAGIVGSLGGAFSTIEGNEIHDIRKDHQFGGCETAGVKLHGAVDMLVKGNHIYRCEHWGGLWLDWMCQGSRVTGNLLHDNANDMMFEMNHGPMLIDNNILLSEGPCLLDASGGGAYVNNIFGGHVSIWDYLTNRRTPYFKPHSTDVILEAERKISLYGADGGSPVSFKAEVANTEHDALYQSLRYGMSTYLLDIPEGSYTVTLQFNEPVYGEANGRVFSVSVGGETVVEKLDVFAQAGKNKAYDITLKEQHVSTKPLEIRFTKEKAEPIISGIKVEGKTVAGASFSYSVNAGGTTHGEYVADFLISPKTAEISPTDLPPNFGKTIDQNDERFYNNIFLGGNALSQYDTHDFKITSAGNIYGGNSKPTKREANPTLDPEATKPILKEKNGEWWLTLKVSPHWLEIQRPVITSENLGEAVLPKMTFQNTDGSPFSVNTDFLGKNRPQENTTAGAIHLNSAGNHEIKVWEKK